MYNIIIEKHNTRGGHIMKKTSNKTGVILKAFMCILLILLSSVTAAGASAAVLPDENSDSPTKAQVISGAQQLILGDVNFDGIVNLSDAIKVQKFALSLSISTDNQKLCGDLDKSGEINLLDSLYLQKFVLQMPINISGIGKIIIIDTVELNKSAITLGVGESFTLIKSSPTGSDLTTAVYKSDNEAVASVTSPGGKISAKKVGNATVTITTKYGATASCEVTVKNAPTSIYLNETSLTLAVGETYCLDTSLPLGEGAYSITYSSSSSSVASITPVYGLVTANKVGTAKITAKAYNGKTASCTVTVKSTKLPSPVTQDNIVNGMSRGTKTLSEVLGFNSQTYLNWLDNHDYDSSNPKYYIGTAYGSGDCRVPYGAKGSVWGHDDTAGYTGMSSTGFIWHILYSACTSGKGDNPTTSSDGYFAGLHKNSKCQYYSPTGVQLPTVNSSDGVSWYNMYSQENVKRYYYKSKVTMLKSGVLKKGDIIWLLTDRTYNGKAAENLPSALHHVGIYYPTKYNGKSVNFWHSGPDGGVDSYGWKTMSNSITQIAGMVPDEHIKIYVVIKVA